MCRCQTPAAREVTASVMSAMSSNPAAPNPQTRPWKQNGRRILKHKCSVFLARRHTKSRHPWFYRQVPIIYTIICLKSVSQATFADCRSQFLLDRLGRCLKLIVSYRGTSSHEFASQFGLAFFLYVTNIHKLSRMPTVAELSVE